MLEFLQNIDVKVFLFLNSINSPFFDKIMVFISGRIEWLPLYLFLIYLMFRWFGKKAWMYISMTILVFALTDLTSVHFFKDVFMRLRPSRNPALEGMVHLVNGYRGGLYGFISSHAANTFGLAVFTSLIFRKKWYTISILIWASIVSYSRIYLGIHFPGDVFVGAIWGSCIGLGVKWGFDTVKRKVESRKHQVST